jgi:hypothetical protein
MFAVGSTFALGGTFALGSTVVGITFALGCTFAGGITFALGSTSTFDPAAALTVNMGSHLNHIMTSNPVGGEHSPDIK